MDARRSLAVIMIVYVSKMRRRAADAGGGTVPAAISASRDGPGEWSCVAQLYHRKVSRGPSQA